MAEPILATDGITHDFGPFRALHDVSLQIAPGTMTGLIGPNGAGKSTLFNVLSGALKPSAGRVTLEGADITGRSPDALFRMGLARSFQIPRPFARMTVLENVMLAPKAQVGEKFWGAFLSAKAMRAQENAIREKALDVLEFVTLKGLADQAAGEISGGQMKLLELARVLMGEPSLILLDEPAAGVNPALTEVLIEKIEALNRAGTTFVIIEHDMDFVMRHCTPVIALGQGRVIFEGTPEQALADPVLLDAYLGAQAHD